MDVLWRTLQFGGELWQDCFEKRRELSPDEIDRKLLGPVDIAPTVFRRLKEAMKNKMIQGTHAILLPTSETAPVLFDEPIIDFSDTRNGWALGNEPTLSLDVFHHTINMLDTIQSDFLDYRTFVDDSTFKLSPVVIPIMKGGVPVGRSFEELFVDSFNGKQRHCRGQPTSVLTCATARLSLQQQPRDRANSVCGCDGTSVRQNQSHLGQ